MAALDGLALDGMALDVEALEVYSASRRSGIRRDGIGRTGSRRLGAGVATALDGRRAGSNRHGKRLLTVRGCRSDGTPWYGAV